MTNDEMLAMQRNLSEKDLSILNAELDRQRKNTLVSYALLLFLAWAGVHQVYLGRTLRGLLYLALFSVGFFGIGRGGTFAVWSLGIWGVLVIFDVVTLPIQINNLNKDVKTELCSRCRDCWKAVAQSHYRRGKKTYSLD